MEQQLHIKYVVKVISITKAGQKVHFTLRHPQNAACLNGIAVTTTNFTDRDTVNDLDATGSLSLAIPGEGDVCYNEDVKTVVQDYREPVEQLINLVFSPKAFAFTGKRNKYFNTELSVQGAFMEVYYEDFSPRTISGGGGTVIGGIRGPVAGPSSAPDPNYNVTIYLRYDMREEKPKEENKQSTEPCK